jgi:hypothetical protein
MTSQEFIEYLAALAPAGETALIVRQTPRLVNGEMQFHANGAIKASWPAYLPTRRIKESEAWFGNTASSSTDSLMANRQPVRPTASTCW